MEYNIFQIIIVLFALFALSRTILRIKDKSLKSVEAPFWVTVWVLVIVLAIFPNSLSFITSLVGIGRPVDLLIYLSVILLFYIVFRLYVRIEGLETNITTLTREIAHKKVKVKKK